jgi:hypothetical protein
VRKMGFQTVAPIYLPNCLRLFQFSNGASLSGEVMVYIWNDRHDVQREYYFVDMRILAFSKRVFRILYSLRAEPITKTRDEVEIIPISISFDAEVTTRCRPGRLLLICGVPHKHLHEWPSSKRGPSVLGQIDLHLIHLLSKVLSSLL